MQYSRSYLWPPLDMLPTRMPITSQPTRLCHNTALSLHLGCTPKAHPLVTASRRKHKCHAAPHLGSQAAWKRAPAQGCNGRIVCRKTLQELASAQGKQMHHTLKGGRKGRSVFCLEVRSKKDTKSKRTLAAGRGRPSTLGMPLSNNRPEQFPAYQPVCHGRTSCVAASRSEPGGPKARWV